MKSAKKAWLRALEMTAPIERHPTTTLPTLIQDLAARFDAHPALVSTEVSLSYRELAEACNRYARWGHAQGLGPGDVVCLLMPNSPHYMAIWLGLTRIGVTVSLLNTQQRGDGLAHSIKIVSPRQVIVGAQSCDAIPDLRPRVAAGIRWWAHGAGNHDLPRLDSAVEAFPTDPVGDGEIALPRLQDRALFIYTSGTTGLPKAANVSHFRIMQWTHWFAGMMDITPQDRMYDCLPLYHSVGGIVATGATLVGGGGVVLRDRFSARDFWRDVAEERCTLFQYIGELCRYLVNTAPTPQETAHSLRLCCGNGLRGEVWEQFQRRFRIPQILEYYASTEGSFSLYNCEGKSGAIGRIPPFIRHRMPVEIVKFDLENEMPTRNAEGHCAACDLNEIGEAIGKLESPDTKEGRFEGYVDARATSKKILRNVFVDGDAWYRTGDLMRRDEQGFFYFVDRVGDTFRWKGENVSAAEVTGVLTAYPGVSDAAVYGVEVPGADGRAGMVAIVTEPQFTLEGFRDYLTTRLPEYARPVLLRIVAAIQLTETFKLSKHTLMSEGFDPSCVSGVYVENRAVGAYVALDAHIYERIQAGTLRF